MSLEMLHLEAGVQAAIPPYDLRLIFEGRQLMTSPGEPISSCGIRDKCDIIAILRLRGGPSLGERKGED